MKGKALKNHSLHGRIAASVWLKMFIGGNERCQQLDASSAWVEEIHCQSNKVNHSCPLEYTKKSLVTFF